MKRDLDLVRALLAFIEEHAVTPDGPVKRINLPGYCDSEIQYHIKLLFEAKLIDARRDANLAGSAAWQAKSLTWAGHEFLDAARDDTRWTRLKKTIVQHGTTVPFSIIQSILIDLTKGEFS